MVTDRFEGDRSAWLLAHSHPHTEWRRRAELLARRAHRAERTTTGLADASAHEDVTPSRIRRAMPTESGERGGLQILTALAYYALVVLALPSALVAMIVLALTWITAPHARQAVTPRGRALTWVMTTPWAWWIAAVLAGIAGAVLSPREAGIRLVIGFPVILQWHVTPVAIVQAVWIWVVIGLIWAGIAIVGHGWLAVARISGQLRAAPQRTWDGRFRAVTDADVVRTGVARPGDRAANPPEDPAIEIRSTGTPRPAFQDDPDDATEAPDLEDEIPAFEDDLPTYCIAASTGIHPSPVTTSI